MRKEYRNVTRSKKLMKDALIGLLAEKQLSRITVAELVGAADVSRNTFYAHYQDVYEILGEIRGEYLHELGEYLDEAVRNGGLDYPLPLFLKIGAFLRQDIKAHRVLLSSEGSEVFLEEVKTLFIQRTLAGLHPDAVRDAGGFRVFLEIMAGGAVELLRKCILGRTELTFGEIAQEVNRIYTAGLTLYKQDAPLRTAERIG